MSSAAWISTCVSLLPVSVPLYLQRVPDDDMTPNDLNLIYLPDSESVFRHFRLLQLKKHSCFVCAAHVCQICSH